MRYIKTGSFKRLFSIKRRSFDQELPKESDSREENNNGIPESFPGTESSQRPTWKCFTYQEIFDATDGFSSENLVGKGGYAQVYKGILEDGQAIAVKRLTEAPTDERKEKEFLTEIGTLGHVCHPNVSSLLGCCIDNGLYLIIQFSSKGSVASILHDEDLLALDWKTRYKIAIGTAKGLHYLHKGCPRRIIHRDIKASNILLTADYEPQAKPILENGEIEKLVDPRLGGGYDNTQLNRLAFASSLCIRASSTWRPTMKEVLEVMFEGEMDREKWKMPKEEEEEEEFWGFEDLECECDSSFSTSTRSS
ncbi:probable receptor-like serine/threonine-protein kinase At5g57670 isoform X2 [Camellia sinensis]|uniref:probable receptor-like serine/threonine-protein kinase At5g57670 isoform X2 n=1 Tax=Camellia sinensis TaxID=4442 RepID=UPI0010360F39|nr:probable receptor-like serine/threonine-protein kinase At5g57670 isoform X2 [Camellia sinensis]